MQSGNEKKEGYKLRPLVIEREADGAVAPVAAGVVAEAWTEGHVLDMSNLVVAHHCGFLQAQLSHPLLQHLVMFLYQVDRISDVSAKMKQSSITS